MSASYPVWGWGSATEEPELAELAALAPAVRSLLGFEVGPPQVPAPLPALPVPRVSPPAALGGLASEEPVDRARHSLGRSYSDLIRGLSGRIGPVPDLVLRPRSEADVVAVLDWAGSGGISVVPFGGGTSVVGGVGPVPDAADRPLVSLDLSRLSGLVEVDEISRAARVRAGTLGPAIDAALRPHGLSLRFFPQSYERSTLGGWLATRAAGHYACRLQHIDDLVESVRACTPVGWWQSRRLPGSGAGPSPDRMLLGSEGTLGVITEAWVRVQQRPQHRATATLTAPSFAVGAEAVRALVQAGLAPETCRLIDATEAAITGAGPGAAEHGEPFGASLVLGAESASAPVDGRLGAAVHAAEASGLRRLPAHESGAAGAAWRNSFKAAPLLRERLVLLGVLVETFESAITWDRLAELHAGVTAATESALRSVCGGGRVTCRLTHAYPDGAAPYFTVLAPARRGSELAQWQEIKAAATDAVLAAGGTVTHHHAVGRDHAHWYGQQRPDPFGLAFRSAKAAIDPFNICNPGVLGM